MLRSFLLASLILILTACTAPRASLPQTLMQTVAGSFDHSADRRERLRGQLRRLTLWTHQPPLPARSVQVLYDSEQRAQSWRIDLQGAARSLEDLTGASGVRSLGTAEGAQVLTLEGGPLAGSLALRWPGKLSLVSRAYALHFEPKLLRFVRPAASAARP